MTNPELIQALDYILNRSDEASIEALAEAVVRRRRDIALFGAVDIPDPRRMAKDLSGQMTAGIGSGIEGVKRSVREMAVRIIKEEAPELNDEQVEELCRAWIPQRAATETGADSGPARALPRDVLVSMIEQFISFSQGTMKEAVDKNLRDEIGAWPERYWNAFPPVIRLTISDFLKNKIDEKEFNSKVAIALEMS
ncbi:MAG: hypothetical protein LBD48_04970 [Treponema sp.]|jgi:hypothetical protein|nr:hypothetical protein [Treponema sp.]